jgi:hypothetical protein
MMLHTLTRFRVVVKRLVKIAEPEKHIRIGNRQVLDADITGMPAGRPGEGVTKGYFPKQCNRRGRQLGRVLATRYEEIIIAGSMMANANCIVASKSYSPVPKKY